MGACTYFIYDQAMLSIPVSKQVGLESRAPTDDQFVEKLNACIIILPLKKINVIRAFLGNFQFSIICPLFPARYGQLDKIGWFLLPARLEMLEKVSNLQPKPQAMRIFPASSAEHLIFCQPARLLWGKDKVRNRFVECPLELGLIRGYMG